MNVNEINEHIMILKRNRMHYSPYKYLRQFVTSTKDIYNERVILKAVSFDNKSIDYAVTLILNELTDNQRFRKIECIKILKTMISKRRSTNPLNPQIIEKLFCLFQSLILTSNEETLSVLIKDQPLTDAQLTWLIENYQDSEHIVNLLLNYPFRHELIIEWARKVLITDELQNRKAEVAAILINEHIPEDIELDQPTLMWAIYYSKCTKAQKRKLINKHLDYENYSVALDVATRLEIEEVSKKLLKHYRRLLVNSDDGEIVQ